MCKTFKFKFKILSFLFLGITFLGTDNIYSSNLDGFKAVVQKTADRTGFIDAVNDVISKLNMISRKTRFNFRDELIKVLENAKIIVPNIGVADRGPYLDAVDRLIGEASQTWTVRSTMFTSAEMDTFLVPYRNWHTEQVDALRAQLAGAQRGERQATLAGRRAVVDVSEALERERDAALRRAQDAERKLQEVGLQARQRETAFQEEKNYAIIEAKNEEAARLKLEFGSTLKEAVEDSEEALAIKLGEGFTKEKSELEEKAKKDIAAAVDEAKNDAEEAARRATTAAEELEAANTTYAKELAEKEAAWGTEKAALEKTREAAAEEAALKAAEDLEVERKAKLAALEAAKAADEKAADLAAANKEKEAKRLVDAAEAAQRTAEEATRKAGEDAAAWDKERQRLADDHKLALEVAEEAKRLAEGRATASATELVSEKGRAAAAGAENQKLRAAIQAIEDKLKGPVEKMFAAKTKEFEAKLQAQKERFDRIVQSFGELERLLSILRTEKERLNTELLKVAAENNSLRLALAAEEAKDLQNKQEIERLKKEINLKKAKVEEIVSKLDALEERIARLEGQLWELFEKQTLVPVDAELPMPAGPTYENREVQEAVAQARREVAAKNIGTELSNIARAFGSSDGVEIVTITDSVDKINAMMKTKMSFARYQQLFTIDQFLTLLSNIDKDNIVLVPREPSRKDQPSSNQFYLLIKKIGELSKGRTKWAEILNKNRAKIILQNSQAGPKTEIVASFRDILAWPWGKAKGLAVKKSNVAGSPK